MNYNKLISGLMFIFVDVEPAVGADMVTVEPRFDTRDMEMMVARKIEDLVPLLIDLETDSTHHIRIYLAHCLNRDLANYVFPHSILLLYLLSHVLILYTLN